MRTEIPGESRGWAKHISKFINKIFIKENLLFISDGMRRFTFSHYFKIIFFSIITVLLLSCDDNLPLTYYSNQARHPSQPPQQPQPPHQDSTWDFVGLAGEDDISSILVVPDKPWILYVGISADFSAGTKGKILKSTDWGATWKKTIDSVSLGKIILDPKNENILYAGLNMNNDCIPGVIKSTDAGESWFRIDSMMHLDWETGASITMDPINSNILYTSLAGFFGGGLLKSTDAGGTWFRLPPKWEGSFPPLADGVCGFAIDPKNPNELYLGIAWSGFLMKSYDGGETFSVIRDTFNGLPVDLVVNPYRTNVVYLGCLDGGFSKSNNHGITWEREKSGLPYRSIDRLVFYKDSILFLGSGWDNSGGVFMSLDDGLTWNKIGNSRINAISIDRRNRFIYISYRIAPKSGIYRYKISL